MNFEHMPELKSELGYPLVLGGMALLAVVLVGSFWKLGWFASRRSSEPGTKERTKDE